MLNSQRQAPTLSSQKSFLVDWIGMFVGVGLCILFCCWFGHGRIFWEDEMLGWMLLHDPSWAHMVAAWKMGADGGGFSFYLLGRGWFALFGSSDTSFRLISASCFALGFCIAWKAARRYYSFKPVAFALFTTWFLCPPMVMHMVEGRFYGLLVLATASAVWLILAPGQQQQTPLWLYPAIFAVNGLLTTTHTLGVLYSGFLLAGLVFSDVYQRRFRPLLYTPVILSWLLLWPERQAIQASADVGKPWFWTYPPDTIRFLGAFCGFSNAIALILLLMLLALAYALRKQGSTRATLTAALQDRRPVYCVTAALFAVPLLLGVQAHVGGTSLFINRYLLPVNIGLALAMAEICLLMRWDLLVPEQASLLFSPRNQRIVVVGYAVIILLWDVLHVQPYTLGALNYTVKLTSMLPRGNPVVFEDAWGFTEMIGRQHDSGVRYTYVLDWPHSTEPSAPKLEVTQFHLMENWKKAGYFAGSIQYRDNFLKDHARFYVLMRVEDAKDRNGRIIGNPLATRFSHDHAYEVRRLKRRAFGYSLWLVCQRTCSNP